MKLKVLVVEDNTITGDTLLELLDAFEYNGEHVTTAEAAMEVLESKDIDIVLSDLQLPGHDGFWILEQLVARKIELPVIMITGHASVDSAVEAIKKGAYDYLSKPIDVNRLEAVLTGAARMRSLALHQELERDRKGENPFAKMIGEHASMQALRSVIERVAPTDASVLISGESGTGKELVASAIVALSERSHQPYVTLNSAALPKDMLESELFGHVKGSFTGAIKDRKGRFELAHGGTLFLDEIGDMPMETQVKLLRVLQEGEFERVGGSETIRVDVRILAATNRILLERVEEGLFREDLYYRLNVIQLQVPSLRERYSDIPMLSKHFLGMFSKTRQLNILPEAEDALKQYSWPGNIRELKNIMERLSIICPTDTIGLDDLPREISSRSKRNLQSGTALSGTMDDMERSAIFEALKNAKGVKAEAARQLGIGLKTLYRKLEKYQAEGYQIHDGKSDSD